MTVLVYFGLTIWYESWNTSSMWFSYVEDQRINRLSDKTVFSDETRCHIPRIRNKHNCKIRVSSPPNE